MPSSNNKSSSNLIPSSKKSLTIKDSTLVKRGLEHITQYRARKRKVTILVGGFDDKEDWPECFSEAIKQEFQDEFEIHVKATCYAEEVLEHIWGGGVDIFMPIINNLIIRSASVPSSVAYNDWNRWRIDQVLSWMQQLKRRYRMPIIAFAGWPTEPSFAETVKQAGADFFFPLAVGYKDWIGPLRECIAKLGSSQDLQESEQRISIALDVKLDESFRSIFESHGFKVFWAAAYLNELEEIISEEHVDIAINYQYGPDDFLLRDLVWKFDRTVPVFCTLNWNKELPPDHKTLGFAGYLNWPWSDLELKKRFYTVLPPFKKSIFRELRVWNSI